MVVVQISTTQGAVLTRRRLRDESGNESKIRTAAHKTEPNPDRKLFYEGQVSGVLKAQKRDVGYSRRGLGAVDFVSKFASRAKSAGSVKFL